MHCRSERLSRMLDSSFSSEIIKIIDYYSKITLNITCCKMDFKTMQFGVNLIFCAGPNSSRSRDHCFIHFEASYGREGMLLPCHLFMGIDWTSHHRMGWKIIYNP